MSSLNLKNTLILFLTILIDKIYQMSSNALQRLTNKKGDQLSKILGINSGPSTRIISDMQVRINNPLFKLSMADYEVMCGNKMMVKMMSKVIGCEEKQLKKFCKYINVFKENINSSPKSIKNKINAMKNRGSLNLLPDNVYSVIVDQYKKLFRIKYVLKNWIPINKLQWNMISKNPNAIELLKANPTKINWAPLSKNPNAIKLLKENYKKIDWDWLSRNSNAIELLKANPEKINWGGLSANPAAIELLREKIEDEKDIGEDALINLDREDKINWPDLSINPNAIELLKENENKIDWTFLSLNPNAIELLKANPNEIEWAYLSANPNPEAIELLKANPEEIDWIELSGNPNAIELLKANPTKINWGGLSSNPNPDAIELLKANPKNIDWFKLSANPSIFDEILE